jgi:hypothetical protein
MLSSANDLKAFSIGATDGDIGQVEAFYFDLEEWTIHYIVVNAGGWFSARKLLISPLSVDGVDWGSRNIRTDLTREEVKHSPTVDTHGPLSRSDEAAHDNHYRLPPYRSRSMPRGPAASPTKSKAGQREGAVDGASEERRLRSTKEVDGFYLAANDGAIGHVDDFIIDDQTWTIRYIVVDTRNWWPGKKVVISPRWITRVDWQRHKIYLDMLCNEIRNSPEYDDSSSIEREFEERLHDHYRQPGYWSRD